MHPSIQKSIIHQLVPFGAIRNVYMALTALMAFMALSLIPSNSSCQLVMLR